MLRLATSKTYTRIFSASPSRKEQVAKLIQEGMLQRGPSKHSGRCFSSSVLQPHQIQSYSTTQPAKFYLYSVTGSSLILKLPCTDTVWCLCSTKTTWKDTNSNFVLHLKLNNEFRGHFWSPEFCASCNNVALRFTSHFHHHFSLCHLHLLPPLSINPLSDLEEACLGVRCQSHGRLP